MKMRIRKLSMGGTLAIDASPGKGTTVRIELKLPPAGQAAVPDRTA